MTEEAGVYDAMLLAGATPVTHPAPHCWHYQRVQINTGDMTAHCCDCRQEASDD